MSVQRRETNGSVAWRVRWQEGDRWRSRTFDLKRDAMLFDGDLRRRRRLGSLAALDAGTESLDAYVTNTWAPTYAALLATKTRRTYAILYDHHIAPTLGDVALREVTPELIARWQASRLATGAGPVAVRQSVGLLGNVLQRAFESGRIPTNPARLVRRTPLPRRAEVRPLAPVTVEAMRAGASPRDAVLLAVLAYAGLRPGEALALRWGDVRERTLLVERSLSLGVEKGTKTGASRSVRLLLPLAGDLREWRMRSGRPADCDWIFPGRDGEPWGEEAYRSWRRKAFRRALDAASVDHARPYDLRHGFASLLLHEGRSVIYVARQLGHGAQLTLSCYGHVIDELEDAPHQDAETAILAARGSAAAPQLPIVAVYPAGDPMSLPRKAMPLLRNPRKPTPGLEPGTPSLRVKSLLGPLYL
jgi:integrase